MTFLLRILILFYYLFIYLFLLYGITGSLLCSYTFLKKIFLSVTIVPQHAIVVGHHQLSSDHVIKKIISNVTH